MVDRPAAPSCPAADAVLIVAHHARAQLMEDAEGGFVSRQPELPLELHRRHAGRLAGDQIGGPEPDTERRMAARHDRASQKAGLAAARAARQNARAGGDSEGFGDGAAMWASEPVGPAGALEIGGARRIVGKQPLKLGERLRESQLVALVDVHLAHHGETLALAGVCVNRIGKKQRTFPAGLLTRPFATQGQFLSLRAVFSVGSAPCRFGSLGGFSF